jgi:Tol biopolymer transport system component
MKKIIILTITLLLMLLGASLAFGQSGYDLFQKALVKERAEGKPEEAIKLYKQIVQEQADNRALAAKALLQMGQCYEKLGKDEARKAYEKVIDEYPDQRSEVALARERIVRLSRALAKVDHKPDFRKVRIPSKPSLSGNGVLSPDGKQLAFAAEGSIWVVPLHGKTHPDIVGEPVRLTEDLGAWNVGNVSITWSGDGKWIAFGGSEKREVGGSTKEVGIRYVISSSGGEPRKIRTTLPGGGVGGAYDYRLAISPDGQLLACGLKEDKLRVHVISLADGGIRRLTDDESREPAFSPGGKHVAYVKFFSPESFLGAEVWVIPVEGGTPVPVCKVRAIVVKSPVWSPDGRMIAFLVTSRPRSGWKNSSDELWIVPVSEKGEAIGSPTKIRLPHSTIDMLAGWTSDNKIGLFFEEPEHLAIYTVPATGGKSTQITPGKGWIPKWSPDGRMIYFFGLNVQDTSGLESVPAEGGKITRLVMQSDRRIQPAMPSGENAVSPDGKRILFAGFFPGDMKDRTMHLFTIPVEGGKPSAISSVPEDAGFPCWSPDGESVAFTSASGGNSGKLNIFIMPASGGTANQLTSDQDYVAESSIGWSPNGDSIAYFGEDKRLRVIPVAGGPARIVTEVPEVDAHFGLTWSPDGKMLAYSAKRAIWVVPAEGGTPTEIPTGVDVRPLKLHWSPDGKKIAFSGHSGGEHELSLMEDFVLLLKTSK